MASCVPSWNVQVTTTVQGPSDLAAADGTPITIRTRLLKRGGRGESKKIEPTLCSATRRHRGGYWNWMLFSLRVSRSDVIIRRSERRGYSNRTHRLATLRNVARRSRHSRARWPFETHSDTDYRWYGGGGRPGRVGRLRAGSWVGGTRTFSLTLWTAFFSVFVHWGGEWGRSSFDNGRWSIIASAGETQPARDELFRTLLHPFVPRATTA